jgi:hypothetical protein
MSKKNRMKKSELEFMKDVDEIKYWNESNLSIEERKNIEKIDNEQFEHIGGMLIYMLAGNKPFMSWVNKQLANMAPAELNLGIGSMHEVMFDKVDASTMLNISNILRVATLLTRKQFYDQVEKCFHGSITNARKYDYFMDYVEDKLNDTYDTIIRHYVYFSIANRDDYGRLKYFAHADVDINDDDNEEVKEVKDVFNKIVVNIKGLNARCNEPSFGRPTLILKELTNIIFNKVRGQDAITLFYGADMNTEASSYFAAMTTENILYTDLSRIKITDNELRKIINVNMCISAEKYIMDNGLGEDDKLHYTLDESNKIVNRALANIMKSSAPSMEDDYDKTESALNDIKNILNSKNVIANRTNEPFNYDDTSALVQNMNVGHIAPEVHEAINDIYAVCMNGTIRTIFMTKVLKLVNMGKTSLKNVVKYNATFYKKHSVVENISNEVEELHKLVDKKQKQLNEMQLECDRLNKRLMEAEEKNRIPKLESNDDEEYNEVEETGEPEIEARVYPKNTILVGGHPNWLKQFKAHYPDVKVYDGDASINVNAITSKTPLVLINTTHLCHAAYHKVKNRLNDIGTKWEYIYPCYRGATNINSVNK